MDSLPNIFQKQIAQQIFPGNAPPEIQYWTFMYRFSPDNYSLRHTAIGKKLSETLGGDCESGINQFIKEVIKKLYCTYQDEIAQDDITEEMLGLCESKRKQGRRNFDTKSPWQEAYKWLWEVKYPRWQQDYIWESWKEVAKINSEWIQFNLHPEHPEYASRGMNIPKPAAKENIPISTPLNLEINIDRPGSYLLLFNRGLDTQGKITKYLIAPSQAFAPDYHLSDKITLMPQQGAMCEDIEFDAVGTEEYVGIVVDEAIDLPWLTPDPANPALEWQGTHLGQVWEQLQDKNWRVFYKDFEVVA
jgi:hypothetical protein